MATFIEGLDPVELTEFARLAAAEWDNNTPGTLSDVFPVSLRDDIRFGYDKGLDSLVDEAVVRAWNAESPLGRRPGAARITGELQPISRKIPLEEYAQLRTRNAPTSAVVDAVFADAPRLARGILARLVRMRWELLLTGEVSINENNVIDTYESGRDAGLTVGAASPLWSSHSTATPLANLESWLALCSAQTDGVVPDTIAMGEKVWSNFRRCDEVKEAAFLNASQTVRIRPEDARDAARDEVGVEIEVVPAIPGLSPKVLPDNMVVGFSRSLPIGATVMGTPLEARNARYQGLAGLPGIVAGGWENEDPVTAWTHAVGIGLPVLAAPDVTFSAQVLAS